MTDALIPRTPSAHSHQLLIKTLLESPLSYNPDQEIVYGGDKRFTYSLFRKRINQLAGALIQLGVKAGDTVAVMDYDSNRYLECYFAVPMIGATLHTVNIRLPPEQIIYTVNHAEDDVILIHSDFLPLLEKIKGRIDTVTNYIVLSEDGNIPETSIDFVGEYEALLADQSDTFEFPDFDENTRATIFYTTGTTGLPKGVYFSHRQLVLHTMGMLAAFGSPGTQGRFHKDDVYMPITPMFHVHAWGVPYVATMLGVKQVYPGRYIPDFLLKLIVQEKVTFSHCVPTILHMLLSCPAIDEMDLSGWKVIIGGAALPKAMCLATMKRGVDIFSAYGLSETCPLLTLAQMSEEMLKLPLDEQADLRTKTGRAVGLVDVRLVDEEMNEVPHDGESTGELVVRAPWLTQGYHKDHHNSEELWKGGYLHTGDVANIDEQGFIKITDRIKDIIKIGGEWVSSLELEDIINQHPVVSEVAVIGTPDDKWGERPLALVVPLPEKADDTLEKSILKHTMDFVKKGIMARENLLLKVQLVEAIDKTSVGKIDKKVLRQKYA